MSPLDFPELIDPQKAIAYTIEEKDGKVCITKGEKSTVLNLSDEFLHELNWIPSEYLLDEEYAKENSVLGLTGISVHEKDQNFDNKDVFVLFFQEGGFKVRVILKNSQLNPTQINEIGAFLPDLKKSLVINVKAPAIIKLANEMKSLVQSSTFDGDEAIKEVGLLKEQAINSYSRNWNVSLPELIKKYINLNVLLLESFPYPDRKNLYHLDLTKKTSPKDAVAMTMKFYKETFLDKIPPVEENEETITKIFGKQ